MLLSTSKVTSFAAESAMAVPTVCMRRRNRLAAGGAGSGQHTCWGWKSASKFQKEDSTYLFVSISSNPISRKISRNMLRTYEPQTEGQPPRGLAHQKGPPNMSGHSSAAERANSSHLEQNATPPSTELSGWARTLRSGCNEPPFGGLPAASKLSGLNTCRGRASIRALRERWTHTRRLSYAKHTC